MAKTVADVMKMVKENEVKFVDFRFTDTRGKEQHVTVPISAFDEDKFSSGHALTVPRLRVGKVLRPRTCF
jgi:glutamine synthetase